MKRLENKVAIVTGAYGGIGLATAPRLASEGARLALLARDAGRLAEALSKVEAAGAPDALMLAGDVADEKTAKALVATTCKRFGGLDVVVNNAGALNRARKERVGAYAPLPALGSTEPLVEFSAKDWRRVLGRGSHGRLPFRSQYV